MAKLLIVERYRPYKAFIFADIREEMLEGFMSHNIEITSYCFAELSERKNKNIKNIKNDLTSKNLEPIPWLETAAGITRKYKSVTEGKHNVYIILLDGVGKLYRND